MDKLRGAFGTIKINFPSDKPRNEDGEDYIEISPNAGESSPAKIVVKYFTLTDFEDTKEILDSLRDGYTIAFVRIKPLRDKNVNELRRAVDKIKKTCFALEGEVVGLEEEWIVATPPYVQVFRGTTHRNEEL